MESTAQGFVEGTFSGTIDGIGSGALQFAKSPNSFCFIGGTFVLTSKGYKVIEEIRIGDKVLATDPETGDTTEKTVLQTFERQTTEFVDVTIGDETYTTTPEHPFYVEDKDFVNASELKVGDKVVCYDTETDTTETKEVEEVHNYETDEPVTVYNFEVHEYHTYHVGEDGVLVHNDCKKPGGNGSGGGNSSSSGGNGSGRKSFLTGKAGEEELAKMVGGQSQKYYRTSIGGRYIDQMANGIAHESKVGYTSLSKRIQTQILKDVELIGNGTIEGSHWHFFTSGVTGLGGPSQPLADFLTGNGIQYTIH